MFNQTVILPQKKILFFFIEAFFLNRDKIQYFPYLDCKIIVIELLKDYTDSELILLWQQGNEPAFEVIYKKYTPQLLRIAMQKVGGREIARELVQDTFIALFKNKSTAHNITSIFAYLYTVLKNRILDEYRHSLVHQKYESYTINSFNEVDNSTQAWIDTRELEKKLNAEIEKLPQQCRTVFKLSRKSYLSNKAIASQLQISENTVEQHMRKALRILRGSLFHYEKILILLALNPTIFHN